MSSVKIKEIFSSIQGEGPYIGTKQLFVRFCDCNLNCSYCDTDFSPDENTKSYSALELAQIVNKYNVHFVSLTGGEPLLFTEFLKEFIPLCNHKIYLETNGTLPDELEKIIDMVDIVSADLKIESSTGYPAPFEIHDKFFEIASKKEFFVKLVFSSQITDEEIISVCKLAKKYGVLLVLQPVTDTCGISVSNSCMEDIYNKFLSRYNNVRLIPQVHKLINVR